MKTIALEHSKIPRITRISWDNRSGPGGACNTSRSLTRSSGTSREGLPIMVPATCSIDGCESKKYCRGFCIKHYGRWRSHGDPQKVIVQTKVPCTVEACPENAHAHGYCASHLYRFKAYGDPLTDGPGQGVGRKRMAKPSYAGIHKRIFYDKGKASGHSCVDCGERAQEWSYDGGCPNELHVVLVKRPVAYSVDQSRYSPRCLKCHRSRDESLNRPRGKDGRFMA